MQNPSCPQCQSPIPADAPGGLCPACVLLGVAGATNPSQTIAANAPTLDEVAAAFPELQILELIGQGGMGVVFKALQPRLDRLVALKILPPALAAQPGFAERFTREARVLARLAHPHIVAIYDFGESAGFFFLIMEFVNGVNLRAAMRAGVKPEQALMLVPKICEALQFAHDHGVLHRDIKPENILLDTRGVPKLADFGIAKFGDSPTGLTQSGAALGTAAYMAPEQVEKPATVDHRADIYSLGVVLYEMLTGELPLGRFAAPSEKSTVNAGVDEVVMRALEKERERRQQSAGEMKTQVEGATHQAARPAYAPRSVFQDPLITRIFVALTLLSAIGIPLVYGGLLRWPDPPRLMIPLTIFFGALALISKWLASKHDSPALLHSVSGGIPSRPLAEPQSSTAPVKQKDLGVAYLCWFLLGFCGLHKFYLGKIGWGFLYFFTGGLFFVGWFIDLFTLPSQVRRYNEEARNSPPVPAHQSRSSTQDSWPLRIFLIAVAIIAVLGLIVFGVALMSFSARKGAPHVSAEQSRIEAALASDSAPSWRTTQGEIPRNDRLGNNRYSAQVLRSDRALAFVLWRNGAFTRADSTGLYGSLSDGSWLDRIRAEIPNAHVFDVQRRSADAFHLTINEQSFDLRKGRVFVLGDDGNVIQHPIQTVQLRGPDDLEPFAAQLAQLEK